MVLEPGTITVQAIKDSIQNASVRGTKSNLDVSQFLEEISTFNLALREISFELRNAMLRKDSLNISDLQDQYDNMVAKLTDFELTYITDNPDSYVSSLILEHDELVAKIKNAQLPITLGVMILSWPERGHSGVSKKNEYRRCPSILAIPSTFLFALSKVKEN